ncbi:DUF624 domain-containing protein [Micromonospora sp. HM5-17]|uniref:DUF624 domain-containing protein n=1 Tax=Micromonospora sp. HM5-17 TaxID=2487710 RepID=UPI000F486F08|nr:DUF624 domain-containing protein [Micromonospora sp. HM5-17]ROT29741.1 DUF624 domain-containing protein [Micromonospora sp. HM5-17]
MSDAVGTRRQFGTGPLSRAAALIYSLLVVEVLLVLGTLPGLVPLILLDRDVSNLPLAAACAVPLGPAVAAALYALHHHRGDLTELHPAAAFWRGYRASLGPVLKIWVPLLLWLTIVAVNLANFHAAAVPGWWRVPLIMVGVVTTLWGVNALVVTALFVFRTRDVARLAVHFLGRTPQVTLGTAGLLLTAAVVTAVTSEAVLALLGSVFTLALLGTSRPMINRIREEFVA